MYPKNAGTPPRIAVGPVVRIADGAVQTVDVLIRIQPEGGGAGGSLGGGVISYVQGIVHYAPTQPETDYTAFTVTAYKANCIPVSKTVVTTASDTAGKVDVSAIEGGNATDAINAACDTALNDYGPNTTPPPTTEEINIALSAAHGAGAWMTSTLDAATINTVLAAAHGAGSWLTGAGVAAPTVEEIDAELSTSHGASAWTTGAGGAGGSGSTASTITVKVDGSPVDGVAVWVTTDLAGANVVAGTVYTDALGQVNLTLDPGTYYVWRQLAGYNFVNSQTITVS